MGYKLAGFRVVGNCEIDPRIAEIYTDNLHPEVSFVMDLRQFNERESLPSSLDGLDVLDGSPPCSTFSVQGKREEAWGIEKKFAEGQKLQRLDDLFFVFLDTVEKLRPKVVVAENVKGMLIGNARGYVGEISDRFEDLGYSVQCFKLNAARMGVPQRRERIFFIANRMDYPRLRLEFNEEPIRFSEVRTLNGVPIPEDKESYALINVAKPTDVSFKTVLERTRGRQSRFGEQIFHDNRVAQTLTAGGEHYRFCDRSYLSEGDFRNISSFPQDYDFHGKAKFICGMSVPPVMMANIAHEIREQWLDA